MHPFVENNTRREFCVFFHSFVQFQNEKRRMLLEAEQSKMEMYEKEYEQVVADWKAGLPIRKQASLQILIFTQY